MKDSGIGGNAFADPRGAASPRDDGTSLGDRNAPTATYAMFSPAFHMDEKLGWRGGQFRDGRAATLEDQAGGLLLNPIEMAMADEAAVIARPREDPVYGAAFPALFGGNVLDDPATAYPAVTQASARSSARTP